MISNLSRRCLANHYSYLGEIYEYMEKNLRKFKIENP
jgi:hypothetical protein